jgi:hypothetical protein
MKEVHYWIANDGTEFYDEDECRLHELENELLKVEDLFCFYDDKKVPIALDGLNAEDVWYIKVDDEKAIEPIEEWFEVQGCNSPFYEQTARETFCGIWAYRENGWVNLVWELADLQCELKDFGLCR